MLYFDHVPFICSIPHPLPSPTRRSPEQAWTSNDLKIRRPSAPEPDRGTSPLRTDNFKRVPTAPSVPARTQSYGYEEATDGSLVMQKAPDVGHTGMSLENRYRREWRSPKTFVGAKWDDTVGPAKYDPQVDSAKQVRAGQGRAEGLAIGTFLRRLLWKPF